jgi:hypothetical protein
VFHTVTIVLEGHAKDVKFGKMWECVPVLKVLLNTLIKLQTEYPLLITFRITDLTNPDAPDHVLPGVNPVTEFMCESINNAWKKL